MSTLTLLQSVEPGDFWLHGAPTAHLNTTFLLNCAALWSEGGVWHVGVISSELSAAVLQRKMPECYDRDRVVFYEPGDWERILREPHGSLLSWNMLIVDRYHGFPVDTGRSMNFWVLMQERLFDMKKRILAREGHALMASYSAHRTNQGPAGEPSEHEKVLERPATIATFATWQPPQLTIGCNKFQEKTTLFQQRLHAAPERGWIDLTGNSLTSAPAEVV